MADFAAQQAFPVNVFDVSLATSGDFETLELFTPSVYLPDACTLGAECPPVPTPLYSLAAYDSVSRRYWTSTTVDFSSAPAPVGAWDVATLTVLSTWT